MIDGLVGSDEAAWLGRCFGVDFRRAVWFRGPVSRLVTACVGAAGITLGPVVLLSPTALDGLRGRRRELLLLLAHELAHVVQYRRLGVIRFLGWYCGEYLVLRWRGHGHRQAYWSLTLERQARLMAGLVVDDWGKHLGGSGPVDSGAADETLQDWTG